MNRLPTPEEMNQLIPRAFHANNNNNYVHIPVREVNIAIREGPELSMRRNNIGANAIDFEDFVNGETVDVLYTADQVQRMDVSGEQIRVTPSMVLKTTSAEELVKSGSRRIPATREPFVLRERRILRLTEGGKRKNRKSTRKNRKSRKSTRKNRIHQ